MLSTAKTSIKFTLVSFAAKKHLSRALVACALLYGHLVLPMSIVDEEVAIKALRTTSTTIERVSAS